MRTPIAIQAIFNEADGTPAAGRVCVAPSTPSFQGAYEYAAGPTCGVLNGAGQLVAQSLDALTVWATDDAGVSPSPPYTFTIRVDGQAIREFTSGVPAASTAPETNASTIAGSETVGLSDLVACTAMIRQGVSGGSVPIGATVTAVDPIANTITLSAPATATAAAVGLTVGGCASLAALEGQV